MPAIAHPVLERRLKAAIEGKVLADAFSRGRYATDASIYQVMPAAVVLPKSVGDVSAALAIAREEGVAVTARGGGTSQAGQTVNSGVILDMSRHLNGLVDLDVAKARCTVEPGIVLDELNRRLAPHRLWFPVDISTASRATIGGMTGNNACGGRSIRYGIMRDNVAAIDALLADGTAMRFAEIDAAGTSDANALVRDLLALGAREAGEVAARFPKMLRRVGGYNLDALAPGNDRVNLAHLLVGSEGTLALSARIELKLSPVPANRAFGICHFGSFRAAMEAARHLVTLGPLGVELVDDTMIGLARAIAMFRPTVEAMVRGAPAALLIVEFDGEDMDQTRAKLARLGEMMGDLGFGWDRGGAKYGGVVEVSDAAMMARVTDVRTSGLNIMMSMKAEGKPVSFVEDCAVELTDLADYTERLTAIFERHGTKGTWYAHASVGCLHVRPVLNLKLDKDVKAMRAIAEETFDMVAAYKGSHSGEHGDGIVRSEFHERMFGSRLVAAFGEVKDRFDPNGVLNPGRVVRAPKMDDRSLMRYPPGYGANGLEAALDWSDWPGAGGGLQGAVEMCNNNGACRARGAGVMCPSYRVTGLERDVTRGRANTLRLAITGQLGPNALASDEMAEALSLCVSCKACRRECPTGVDMARMKIEVLNARVKAHGLTRRDRMIATLPKTAPQLSALAPLVNFAGLFPGARWALERFAGLSARRSLPRWRRDVFDGRSVSGPDGGREVMLLADTFNRHFEPENLSAAMRVLAAGGYRVTVARADDGGGNLCCGRTYLAAGLVDEARAHAGRLVAALAPHVERGVPVIGLEPSCLLTLRDEIPALIGREAAGAIAGNAFLLEEFLARERAAGRLDLKLKPAGARAMVHGHCHQKAFAAFEPVIETLRLVPGLEVEPIQSGCCGMAGAFGYGAETYDVSLAMAGLDLLPAIEAAPGDTIIVADGTSCRHQIRDATGREPVHAAVLLDRALDGQASDRPAWDGPAWDGQVRA